MKKKICQNTEIEEMSRENIIEKESSFKILFSPNSY